jgi:uncharacterized protein YjbI with pentapeptide repeats
MPGRPRGRGVAGPPVRGAASPRQPPSLRRATLPEHGLAHEAAYRRLEFLDVDLSGGCAELLEFRQCRLRNVDLSGTVLDRTTLTDCLVENSNLANLHVEKSAMLRVRLAVLRMTGVHAGCSSSTAT